MNFESPGPLKIEEIIQNLVIDKNRDFKLFLMNRLHRFQPSRIGKDIMHIQPRKSRILKKNTIGLFEISGKEIVIYTSRAFIYFAYTSSNTLYEIFYSLQNNRSLQSIT